DLTRLPGSSLPNSTASVETDNNNPSSIVTLNNITPGSWAAFTSSYRNNQPNTLLTASITSGIGTLVATGQSTSGQGNLWGTATANTIEAGGLISNIQSSTLTLTETNGYNSYVHWTTAAAVF